MPTTFNGKVFVDATEMYLDSITLARQVPPRPAAGQTRR
jgi:hypothetical protein